MNIDAIRFATHTRTGLLIAALTGLLVAVGGAIGGVPPTCSSCWRSA